MNKRITIISCVSLGCAVVIATAGLTTKNNNSDLIQVGQIDASIEPSIEQSIEPSMEPLSNEDVMDEQVETLHTSTPETITPSSNPEDAVNKSSAKPQETTKPQVTSKPKTVNNTYKSTMYDYSKAGVKSATGRVVPEDYISVTEFGVTPNSGNDVSGKVEKAIYSATQKGKYLYFPEGTYYMKNVKIYDADNVKICGAGEKTILKTANDATGDVWDIVLGIYNSNGPIVRNLVFDGNNKVVPGNLTVGVIQLRLENCDNAKVYGCRFQNNNSGNLNIVDEAKNLEVFYCDFLNSDCSIITSPGYITKGYLCNNFIDGQDWKYSEPISLYYAEDRGTNTDVIISGNDIRNHDNGAGAIFITYPSTNISILNNYIYKCGAGIGSGSQRQVETSTLGPVGIIAKNNVIDTPTWHGFGLLYADNWTITDNVIKNVTDGFGVFLDQCDNNTVKNNNLGGSRVFEENCSGNSFSGNK